MIKIDKKLSIILPIRARRAPVNTVEACIRSLVFNSKLDNEIIIVKDRFELDSDGDTSGTKKWLNEKSDWFNNHNVKVVDCPKTEKLKDNELGAYIAGNYGVEIAENDFVLEYSDCDFYYHKNWDINLMNVVERVFKNDGKDESHLRYSFTPILVRAVTTIEYNLMLERGEVNPDKQNARDIAKMSGCLYFNRSNEVIKESEILNFCTRMMVPYLYYYELCGRRNITSYFPNVFHKELWAKVGGMPEDPAPNVSCDLMFDEALFKNGIIKVTPLDSLLVHTYKTDIVFDTTNW